MEEKIINVENSKNKLSKTSKSKAKLADIKCKYLLSSVFSFLNVSDDWLLFIFKYNTQLMKTCAYKQSFLYNKFLKIVLVEQNQDVINKIFDNCLANDISMLEQKLSGTSDSSVCEKFCFDSSTKKMHEAFRCRIAFLAMENILFKIVSLQSSDFFDLPNFYLEDKDYISKNVLIELVTKIIEKTYDERVSQLFDIICNNENYEIKSFNFYAERAKLEFPEEENRDLIFARLCYIQIERLVDYKNSCDSGRPKSLIDCAGLDWIYDCKQAYQAVYPNDSYNRGEQPKDIDTLTKDLNNFKNQLAQQNLNDTQKKDINSKIRHLGRLIEIKKYTDVLDRIKNNSTALPKNNLCLGYEFAYYFIYAKNPNKLDSVDFKTETYLTIAEELEKLHRMLEYFPQFKDDVSKIFDHQGNFDQKFYECIMRYTNFNKMLSAYIYMDNEHDPYCPYKMGYTGESYSLFKKSKFYAPLKNIIQNNKKISDGIRILHSLKHSSNFILELIKNKNPHKKRNELSNKEQKLSNILSKRPITHNIRDKNDYQGSHFLKQIESNQENNEIVHEQDWPDLNVDRSKKNIYEEWCNKVTKTNKLYEKPYEELAKIKLKNTPLFKKIGFINNLNQQINNQFDNLIARRKKSLKNKLIIGGLINFVCVCALLYSNLIVLGIVSFAIGVCILVFYGIYKSKSNEIQNRLQIPLTTKIKSYEIEINDQNIFLARFKSEHASKWQNENANLIFPEI